MGVRRDRRVGPAHPIVLGAAAAGGFFVTFLIVDGDKVEPWEIDLTNWINDVPSWSANALWPVMQLGSLWSPLLIGSIAAFVFTPRRGIAVAASGVSAWFVAKLVKDVVERGRPLRYIPDIDVREGTGGGLGFVSGHAAVAFAMATSLLPVLPRWGRGVAYFLATVVGYARVVRGVHFPLDVVGGACLGIMCGCVVELVVLAIPARQSA